MRRLAAVLVTVGAAAGCGEATPSTSLTLVATNPHLGRATFTLRCDPPGGDVPRPASACARLGGDPRVLLRPKPFTCWGGTFSWWDVTVSGRYDGEPVSVRTSTCWTPQMRLIRVLGIGSALSRHLDPLSRPAHPLGGIPLTR